MLASMILLPWLVSEILQLSRTSSKFLCVSKESMIMRKPMFSVKNVVDFMEIAQKILLGIRIALWSGKEKNGSKANDFLGESGRGMSRRQFVHVQKHFTMAHGEWEFGNWRKGNDILIQPAQSRKKHGGGRPCCSQCGEEIKIIVSPWRNPHSNKLGRAVTMKHHDLCRRCWRHLLQGQLQKIIRVA